MFNRSLSNMTRMAVDEKITSATTVTGQTIQFDEVLDIIGGFKFFQKWVTLLASLPYLIDGLLLLAPAFYLGIPDHRCKVPGYENDTYEIQNEFHRCLLNLTIPPDEDEDDTYDPCHVYVTHNVIQWCQGGGGTVPYNVSRNKIECSDWVYDTAVYDMTFVSQENLVCGKTVWAANAVMIYYGGMLISAVISITFSDIFGRKPVMYISFWIMAIASIGLSFCKKYWQFVLTSFIQGLTLETSFMPPFVTTMEITGVDKRLWPGVVTNIPYLLGVMILAAMGYFIRTWDKLVLYTGLPCILLLSYWWLMPESPRWLLSRQRKKEAEAIMVKAAKWNGTSLPEKILDKVVIEEEPSWKVIFKAFKSRKMCVITVVTCFNWMVVSIGYYGLSLNMSTLAGNFYLNFALSGLVEGPGYLIVIFLVDRVGRRRLYCGVMMVGGLALGSTFFTLQYGAKGKTTDAIILTLTLIGKFGATAGWGVQYLYTAELFPTFIRAAGLSLASLVSRVGTMICPYIVILGQQIGGTLGDTFALVLIGILCILSTLATLLLPETVDQPMPETIEDVENLGREKKTPKVAVDEQNQLSTITTRM